MTHVRWCAGTVYIKAGAGGINVVGSISVVGAQGLPLANTAAAAWWVASNSQASHLPTVILRQPTQCSRCALCSPDSVQCYPTRTVYSVRDVSAVLYNPDSVQCYTTLSRQCAVLLPVIPRQCAVLEMCLGPQLIHLMEKMKRVLG